MNMAAANVEQLDPALNQARDFGVVDAHQVGSVSQSETVKDGGLDVPLKDLRHRQFTTGRIGHHGALQRERLEQIAHVKFGATVPGERRCVKQKQDRRRATFEDPRLEGN